MGSANIPKLFSFSLINMRSKFLMFPTQHQPATQNSMLLLFTFVWIIKVIGLFDPHVWSINLDYTPSSPHHKLVRYCVVYMWIVASRRLVFNFCLVFSIFSNSFFFTISNSWPHASQTQLKTIFFLTGLELKLFHKTVFHTKLWRLRHTYRKTQDFRSQLVKIRK